jgi:hypothetical protein
LQIRRLIPLVVCALALAPAAHAAPNLYVGAAEDASRGDFAWAKPKMDLAAAAGFDAIRLTSIWSPGETAPSELELLALRSAAQAAEIDGIRILITVMPYGSKTVPLTAKARADFASYAAALVEELPTVHDYIVGNEPNINRYWLPQFGPNGTDAAAVAYMKMLAESYDAMKAVDRSVNVIGGSVSPRGSDNPASSRHTHSPTQFILDLGEAYRALARSKPVMDAFAFHPYGEHSHVPPTFTHPKSTTIGLGDYPKLVALLGKAFNGTAQKGSSLPIVYDEYGVQSQIPGTKQHAYKNLGVPSGRDAVPESVQANYYRQAILMAACQPTVKGLLIFHVTDEPDLDRWQSGVYYADDTPKPTRAIVKRAIAEARDAQCGTSTIVEPTSGALKGVWQALHALGTTLSRG